MEAKPVQLPLGDILSAEGLLNLSAAKVRIAQAEEEIADILIRLRIELGLPITKIKLITDKVGNYFVDISVEL
jgi:hypothetical protein